MGGGGIGLYVRDTFSVEVLVSSDPRFDNSPEFIICELRKDQLRLLFAAIYRRPHASYPTHFFDCLSNHLPHYPSVIVAGDFNMNMALPSTSDATHLNNSIFSNSLYLVPSEPTHHQLWRGSHTWIDLFIVKSSDRVLSYTKSDAPFIAGHDFIELSLACAKTLSTPKSVMLRDLKRVEPGTLLSVLSNHFSALPPLAPFSSSTFIATTSTAELVSGPSLADTDAAERALSSALINAFDNAAPLRKLTLSTRHKPWVNTHIRALMRSRDRAYRLARSSGKAADHASYRALCSQTSNALDSAKNAHVASCIADAPSIEAKWRELRRLNLTRPNLPSPLTKFSAADLNAFYASTVCRHPPITDHDFETIAKQPSTMPSNTPFCLRPISSQEVAEALHNSSSKATGHDGLSIPMLKLTLPYSLPFITDLFNSSIVTATFPTNWKKATIRPLAKSKSMLQPSDTRPISQLPELSKVLERLVHNQLQGFLEANNLLHPRQAGFRPGHSTQTALLGVFDDIRHAIDDRKLTFLILFDFSKAFDSIPHTILLAKLNALSFSTHALRWFFSYLSDRLQTVIDTGGKISDWLRAESGVPQGSVLGPLLFAVFINDLPAVIRFSKVMIFADDTQLYHHFLPANFHHALDLVTRDAQAVADWARKNGLTLNSAKTKVLILGSDAYTRELDLLTLPRVVIDGQSLPYVTEARSLGVLLSNTLDWQDHAKHVTRKVFGSLYTLRFFSHALTRDVRKHLVETLIFPTFDYAAPVYNHLDKERTERLEKALKACVRFVVGRIPRRDHVTPYRLTLGWLSAKRRRLYFVGLQAFKVVTNAHPLYLTQRFNCRLNIDLDLRRSDRRLPQPFEPPPRRTEAFKHSFALEAMDLLNTLHFNSFSLANLPLFKRTLKGFLFSQDVADWNARVRNEGLPPCLSFHLPPATAVPCPRL